MEQKIVKHLAEIVKLKQIKKQKRIAAGIVKIEAILKDKKLLIRKKY